MTRRNQQELFDLLVSFKKEIGCGRDCAACKFGAKNSDRFFNIVCPIDMVDDMLEAKWISGEKFDDMVG